MQLSINEKDLKLIERDVEFQKFDEEISQLGSKIK